MHRVDDPVEPPLFLRWRLLGVRIDATAFSENVTRIPDLKARQELLTNGLDKVRILLEETYPLGTEVYRDANGSMFIVPDIPHLLSLVNGQKELLSDRIKKEFSTGTVKEDASLKLGDEVVPSIEFDPNKKNAWFWYDPASHHAPLPIVDHLTQRPESAAKPSTVSNWWQNYSADICTVCQLRPQGWGATDRKALHRKLCAVCEERRNDRCADWTTQLATTIWLDEVADVYGRLALVVGKLDLKHWLDGTLIFYPAAVSEENTNQIKARVIFPFKTVGNSTPPAELRLLDRTYKLNPSLRIFESTRYIKGDQLPLRFKSNKLKIAGSNESVKVMDVEGLPNGSYSITIDRLPPNVSPDSSFSIQKSSRQIIDFHVAADGPQLEAISPSAVEFIEDEILYAPGVILEQRIVQPVVVEAQTPARIQRVWKTAQQFWEQQEKKIGEVIKPVSSRLRLKTRFEPSSKEPDSLATYHTYELKVDNLDLSIVRVAKDEFLTIDNLSRAAVLLSPSKAEVFEKDYDEAENHVRAKLLRDRRFQVEQPTGYGSPNKLLGTLYIEDVTPEETIYAPFVTILKEPGTFMVLVPATEALNAVNSIREIYNDQMGKVRSRLPLTVGIVFAGRRTPLPAILNAGRRMLELPTIDECWEIDSISEEIDPWSKEVDPWPNRIKLQMRKDETALPATVQITLGDEKQPIPDRWYPYWEMGSPYSDDWVHTCDLRKGNKILMSSSRFDFEFLDTAARRFEISYNNGKRRGTFLPGSTYHPARPYYLEQLEEFDKLWTALSEGLETTQIDSLIGIIEEKRMEWLVDRNDEVFRQAVYDALDNADWKADKRPNADQFKQLRRTALSGQLTDVVELYISILKQRPEADESQTKNMMGVTL